MIRAAVICCCLIAAGCAGRGQTYSYNSSTKVALLNATSPAAQYYSFKAVTNENHEYPVNWGIPQLVERAVRFSTPNAFISYPAPDWLRTTDLKVLKNQLGSKGSPSMQESLAAACAATKAKALLILGTSEVNWMPESQVPKQTHGYGMFTASGSYVRPYFAYAIVAASAINCTPLAHVDTVVLWREPPRVEGLEAYIMPDSLTPGVLRQVKPGVIDALETPVTPESQSVLLSLVKRTNKWFGAPTVLVIR